MFHFLEQLLQRTNSTLLRFLFFALLLGLAVILLAVGLIAYVVFSILRLFGFRPRFAPKTQFGNFQDLWERAHTNQRQSAPDPDSSFEPSSEPPQSHEPEADDLENFRGTLDEYFEQKGKK